VSTRDERLWERFRADPAAKQAFEVLEEHLFLASDWDALITLYQERVAGVPAGDERLRAPVLLRMGQVMEERKNDVDGAIACYGDAVRADPTLRLALRRLREIHSRRNQWDVALQIAETELGLSMPVAERAALRAEMGLIWLDALSDAATAQAEFEQALAENPAESRALGGAARALEVLGRPREAAAAWKRLAAQLAGPERARALVAQARILSEELEQGELAFDLYRRALGDDPENAEALDALAIEAAASERWDLLADLHERRFARARSTQRKSEIALEAGLVHAEKRRDLDLAHTWLSRSVEVAPEFITAYEALARVAEERGDENTRLQCVERVIELSGSAPPVEALLEVASIDSEQGDDLRALEHLVQAFQLEPDNVRVGEAYSSALAKLGRHDDLVDVLERRAALSFAEPGVRAHLLTQLARVYEEHLDDPGSAEHAFERAFQAWPGAPGVVGELERLYRKSESWDPLREMLEVAGRDGPADQRSQALTTLGELLVDRYDNPAAATRAFQEALEVDPGAIAAHRGLQILAESGEDPAELRAAYEREVEFSSDSERRIELMRELLHMARSCGDVESAREWARRWAEADPESSEALVAHASLLENTDSDDELADVLARLERLVDGPEVANIRRRLGDLHQAAGRRDDAIRAYEGALAVVPDDVEALEALSVQYDVTNRVHELVRTRQRLADLLPPPRNAFVLDSLATLLEERLNDVDGAIETLLRLSDSEGAPDGVDERLDALLERAGRNEMLAERLSVRKQALRPGSPECGALAMRLGELLLASSRFDDAAAAFREAHEVTEAPEARENLERALRAAADVEKLAGYLAEPPEPDEDPDRRERKALESAVLLQDRPDGLDEAIENFRRLANAATDLEVRRHAGSRLESALERKGAWSELREYLYSTLGRSTPADDAACHERMGQLCRDRLEDLPGATDHFEEAARLRPERPEAWRVLAEIYEGGDRDEDLVRVLESELATEPGADRELALRTRAADLFARSLSDDRRARAHYERVFELDPGHRAAADYLIEPWEREGQYAKVVEILEARASALDGDRLDAGEARARRASLRIRIAELRSRHLGDPSGAMSALEAAMNDVGPQPRVAEPLAVFYEKAGRDEPLIELCTRAAENSDEPAERANWMERVGAVRAKRGEHREAASAYQSVLCDRPADRQAQDALHALYRELGEHDALIHLLESRIPELAGQKEIEARLELATLAAEHRGEPAVALTHLRRVLQIDPTHQAAFDRALGIAEVLGDHEATLEMLDAALDRWQPPRARAGLLARRGSILAHFGGRPEEAIETLREALALDPHSASLRAELRAMLESESRWEEVLQLLYAEAADADDGTRALVLTRAAETAWQNLSPDDALPWLERLRRLRPRDGEVLQRIARVHRQSGRPGGELLALGYELEVTEDDARRIELHLQRACILESESESPVLAALELEAAREIDPNQVSALKSLERIYGQLGRVRERGEVLETLAEQASSEEQVALWSDLGALYAGTLSEPHRGAAYLMRAVAEAPDFSTKRSELLRALGETLRVAGPIDGWARCAEAELASLNPDAPVFADRRRELHRELADVYENELNRCEAALHHLREVVDRAAEDPGPSVARAIDDAEVRVLRLLQSADHVVEREARLAARLEHAPDDAARWLELGQLREEKLHAPAAAAAAYRRVIELEPESLHGIRGLRRTAERVRDWPGVVQALELEIEQSDSRPPAERGALLRRIGLVYWQELGGTVRANRALAAALDADASNPETLHALQSLNEEMEDWSGALGFYEREISLLGETHPERRREIWLRIASLSTHQEHDDERARRAYEAAQELEPLALSQLRTLADLYGDANDLPAFAETLGAWCDDPESGAACADHLEVARALDSLDRTDEALTRAERALTCDERSVPAWDLTASLREKKGATSRAIEALWRASMLLSGSEAAKRLLHAGALCEEEDPERALDLVRAAVERDPADAGAHALLACSAERFGARAEAIESAQHALELSEFGSDADERIIEAALAGGRAARQEERRGEALRFFCATLSMVPDHPAALAGRGETLAGYGDLEGAWLALEKRLALGDRYPERALHLTLAGRHFATAGDPETALEHLEEALREDPAFDDAHREIVALHRAAGSLEAGLEAIDRWAGASDRAHVAERLLVAAEWELATPGHEDAAEQRLRHIVETEPACGRAWQLLAQTLSDAERLDDGIDVCRRALDNLEDADARADVALIHGRMLESNGDRRGAADAFGLAASYCSEAALSRARLLRAIGDWSAAAETLREYVGHLDSAELDGLSEALDQLGRLLAGPLEDFDGAVSVYRRAVQMDPSRAEARRTLAGLLARTDAWPEALDHHRTLLDANPTDSESLRALVGIAREQERDIAHGVGLYLLRALGIASPAQQEESPTCLVLPLAEDPKLANPTHEALRKLSVEASAEIAEALNATESPELSTASDGDSFAAATLAAEASLTAPALLPLGDAELGEALSVIATLVLEPKEVHGDGALVNAFSGPVGWRNRRRFKRSLAGATSMSLAQVDYSEWRQEVRTLAHAMAVDESGGDLRAAFESLVCEGPDGAEREITPTTDLTALVEGTPPARRLLRRVLDVWLESLA
jgi:tetratricopeptide (TPR) repeat protein